MFSKFAVFTTLVLPLLAAATPVARNSQHANSAGGAALLGLLGIAVQDVTGLIALDCSPITVVGVGSSSERDSTTVSCTNGVVDGIGIICVLVTL